MGVTVNAEFKTQDGFTISALYLNISTVNFVYHSNGSLSASFTLNAFKSYDDRRSGLNKLQNIPPYLLNIEGIVGKNDFLRMSPFGIIYRKVAAVWAGFGYTLTNVIEEGEYSSLQFTFDASGYNFDGFNSYGFNRQGYNKLGFNILGYNVGGYNNLGFNALGYNAGGFKTDGYNDLGYNMFGFNTLGYNAGGFKMNGYNELGFNIFGYDITGFNASGYNADGFNASGFNASGYNVDGLDINGNPPP